jgi:predicted MFS family arabinose efflux permease
MRVRPSFRDPRFALLVTGETVNSIGGWASAIVLWGFAAYRFNASPYAVGLTIVCWAAPPALLGPLAGVYVDRIGPRAAVVAGYCGAACAALGMAASGSLAELAIAAVAYGSARALAGPAASALPARIVADDDLLAANALLGAAASAGQVAGPLVASAALALSGFPAAFVVDAASYLIGAAVVAPLPVRAAGRTGRPGWRRELTEGLRLVARQRAVRLVMAVSAAVTFTSAAFLVVEPLYARHVLHRPPSQFALFEAAAGIGGILAGLVISRVRARQADGPGPGRLTGGPAVAAAAIGYGLAAGLFTGTTSVPVAYVGAFAWGAAGALFGVVALTALQQNAPVSAHGRVMSVAATIQSWVETLALLLGGLTVAAIGVRAGALTLAGIAVAAGLASGLRTGCRPRDQGARCAVRKSVDHRLYSRNCAPRGVTSPPLGRPRLASGVGSRARERPGCRQPSDVSPGTLRSPLSAPRPQPG